MTSTKSPLALPLLLRQLKSINPHPFLLLLASTSNPSDKRRLSTLFERSTSRLSPTATTRTKTLTNETLWMTSNPRRGCEVRRRFCSLMSTRRMKRWHRITRKGGVESRALGKHIASVLRFSNAHHALRASASSTLDRTHHRLCIHIFCFRAFQLRFSLLCTRSAVLPR